MDRPHFRVANWSEYQHYKDRNPIWIKLYGSILSSEMWVGCSDASRVLAIVCMVIASKNNGCVPAQNLAYIRRQAYLDYEVTLESFKPLIDCGFLEDASGLLAPCYHDASEMLDQRREEERREEERQNLAQPKTVSQAHDLGFEQFWQAYPKRKSKQAALKAWRKLKPSQELQRKILSAIASQKESEGWKKERGQYIPYPATWLNAGGWDDEMQEAEVPWYMQEKYRNAT